MLKNEEKQKNEGNTIVALSLVFEMGYTIAIPAVAFSFGGRFVDKYFHTSPLLLLLGIISALILSAYVIYQKIQKL